MIFLDVCFAPRQKLKPFTQTEEQRPGVLRLALDATQVRFLFFLTVFYLLLLLLLLWRMAGVLELVRQHLFDDFLHRPLANPSRYRHLYWHNEKYTVGEGTIMN